MVVRIPVYCPQCGAVFPAPIALGAGAGVVISNCVTDCPYCGGEAIIEGEFRGAEHAIQIIKSNAVTPERLKAFAGLLRDAYERKATFEETRKRAAEIDPKLGEAIDAAHSQGSKFWRTSLLLMMLVLSRCNFDFKVSIDLNDMAKQLLNQNPITIVQQVPMPRADPRRTAR